MRAALAILLITQVVCGLDPRWQLMWSDEFNDAQLDTSKWTVRVMNGYTGVNDEAEYYVAENVDVSDGNLVLTAFPNTDHPGFDYVSGFVDSAEKWHGTYGRYEVSAKLPFGKGLWPAHWLMSSYVYCPTEEIDIMENLGFDTVYGTYHYSYSCASGGNGSSYTASTDLYSEYHTHAIEWWPHNITWFFDDVAYEVIEDTSLANGNPFPIHKSPHYWILNTAVGGPNSWPGSPDDTTQWPQYHYIDYVRVYAWQPCVTGCQHGCCEPTTQLCVCDGGYEGTFCEYSTGLSYATDFSSSSDGSSTSGDVATQPGLMTMTISGAGCPDSCVTAQWNAPGPLDNGNFTIVAKGPSVSGTALLMWGTGGDDGAFLGFQLALQGNLLQTMNFLVFGGGQSSGYTLPFNHNEDFHVYSVIQTSDAYLVYVDGTLAIDQAYSPNLPVSFYVQYQAGTNYFGPLDVEQLPSSAYLQSASWINANEGKTAQCSAAPTQDPTQDPTQEPTQEPTQDPTQAPTAAPASTVCVGDIGEGQTVTLTCPQAGQVITSVDFASYGTPQGSCGSYAVGSCNADTSTSIVNNNCLNKPSCSFVSDNALFNDPCWGTVKHFDAQVTCTVTANPGPTGTPNTQLGGNSASAVAVGAVCLFSTILFLLA